MNDYRINWAMPMPKLGNKVEQYKATAEDKRAMELCKFEQKRHEVSRKSEQAAFEEWLYSAFPSGDVDDVQRQWLESYERECWLDELEAA